MIIRNLFIFLLTIILGFSSSSFSKSRLNEILESGILRVGTTGDWNPMTIKDPSTNEYKGFDIDVAKELSKDMGVKLEFIPTEWKTLVAGITSDKYDISTSASLNAKRALSAGYSESYLNYYQVPLTLKKNLDKFSDWEDINKQNVKFAVTLGTVQEQMAEDFFPNAQITKIESPARDFQEILSGRADVSMTSNIEAAALVEQYQELAIIPVKEQRNPTPLAWLIPQNDQVWINYINHWIELKKTQGFFEKMKKKWNLNY
tara:strand:+ start:1413 stop:2192 length:780 start_codon:yes stop_codon:yes gene_type:complete